MGIKKKKTNKKGFTLVELIVVLVILAVLAAIMVPALSGWIDKSRRADFELKARYAVQAAQAVGYEHYAKGDIEVSSKGFMNIYYNNTSLYLQMRSEIFELAGLPEKYFLANVDYNAEGKLIFLQLYTTASGQNGTVINRMYYSDFMDGAGNVHEGFELFTWNKTDLPSDLTSRDPSKIGYRQ